MEKNLTTQVKKLSANIAPSESSTSKSKTENKIKHHFIEDESSSAMKTSKKFKINQGKEENTVTLKNKLSSERTNKSRASVADLSISVLDKKISNKDEQNRIKKDIEDIFGTDSLETSAVKTSKSRKPCQIRGRSDKNKISNKDEQNRIKQDIEDIFGTDSLETSAVKTSKSRKPCQIRGTSDKNKKQKVCGKVQKLNQVQAMEVHTLCNYKSNLFATNAANSKVFNVTQINHVEEKSDTDKPQNKLESDISTKEIDESVPQSINTNINLNTFKKDKKALIVVPSKTNIKGKYEGRRILSKEKRKNVSKSISVTNVHKKTKSENKAYKISNDSKPDDDTNEFIVDRLTKNHDAKLLKEASPLFKKSSVSRKTHSGCSSQKFAKTFGSKIITPQSAKNDALKRHYPDHTESVDLFPVTPKQTLMIQSFSNSSNGSLNDSSASSVNSQTIVSRPSSPLSQDEDSSSSNPESADVFLQPVHSLSKMTMSVTSDKSEVLSAPSSLQPPSSAVCSGLENLRQLSEQLSSLNKETCQPTSHMYKIETPKRKRILTKRSTTQRPKASDCSQKPNSNTSARKRQRWRLSPSSDSQSSPKVYCSPNKKKRSRICQGDSVMSNRKRKVASSHSSLDKKKMKAESSNSEADFSQQESSDADYTTSDESDDDEELKPIAGILPTYDTDSSSEDSEKLEIASDNECIDSNLQAKSKKFKFTAKNVKSLIHQVIKDESVSDMFRRSLLDEKELTNQLKEAIFEPKMTRAKVKEVTEKGNFTPAWALSPIKNLHHQPQIAKPSILDIDFPEEEDNEYKPSVEELEQTDDDDISMLSSQASDFGSPNLTLLKTSPIPAKAKDSLFSRRLFEESSTPRTSVGGASDLETEELIASRTRSKKPLVDTTIDVLESNFIAPDITPDLYDTNCTNPDWTDFLGSLTKDTNQLNDTYDDEQNDPEFNFLKELEQEAEHVEDEREDCRDDKAVKISKKELNELMDELFEAYGGADIIEDEDTALDLTDHTIVDDKSPETQALSSKKKCGIEEGTFRPPKEDSKEILPSELAPVAKVATPTKPSCPYHLPPLQLGPEFASLLASDLIKIQGKVKIPNSTKESKVAASSVPHSLDITEEQKIQVQDQMRKYVQLLAQSFIQAAGDPKHKLASDMSSSYLLELKHLGDQNLSRGYLKTSFHPPNLTGAIQLCSTKFEEDEEDVKETVKENLVYHKVILGTNFEKCSLNMQQMKIFANSDVFLFPQMLPEHSFYTDFLNDNKRQLFSEAEDNLLILGLDQFASLPNKFAYIQQFLLPAKSEKQIRIHYKNLKTRRKQGNPIDSELPKFERYTQLEDSEDIVAPKFRPKELLPKWFSALDSILRLLKKKDVKKFIEHGNLKIDMFKKLTIPLLSPANTRSTAKQPSEPMDTDVGISAIQHFRSIKPYTMVKPEIATQPCTAAVQQVSVLMAADDTDKYKTITTAQVHTGTVPSNSELETSQSKSTSPNQVQQPLSESLMYTPQKNLLSSSAFMTADGLESQAPTTPQLVHILTTSSPSSWRTPRKESQPGGSSGTSSPGTCALVASPSIIGAAMAQAAGITVHELNTPEGIRKLGVTPSKVPGIVGLGTKKKEKLKKSLTLSYEQKDSEYPAGSNASNTDEKETLLSDKSSDLIRETLLENTKDIPDEAAVEQSVANKDTGIKTTLVEIVPSIQNSLDTERKSSLPVTPTHDNTKESFKISPVGLNMLTENSTFFPDTMKHFSNTKFTTDVDNNSMLVTPKKITFADEISHGSSNSRGTAMNFSPASNSKDSVGFSAVQFKPDTPSKVAVQLMAEFAKGINSPEQGHMDQNEAGVLVHDNISLKSSELKPVNNSQRENNSESSQSVSVDQPELEKVEENCSKICENSSPNPKQFQFILDNSPTNTLEKTSVESLGDKSRKGQKSPLELKSANTSPKTTDPKERNTFSFRCQGRKELNFSGKISPRKFGIARSPRKLLPAGPVPQPQPPKKLQSRKKPKPPVAKAKPKQRAIAPKGVIVIAPYALSPVKKTAAALTARAKQYLSPQKHKLRSILPKPTIHAKGDVNCTRKQILLSPSKKEKIVTNSEDSESLSDLEEEEFVMTRRKRLMLKKARRQSRKATQKALPSKEQDSQEEGEDDEHLARLMAASTTIGFDPNKQDPSLIRSKVEKKRDNIKEMLAPDLLQGDVLRDERDTVFAQSYMTRVRAILQAEPDKYETFLKLLYDFGKNKSSPVELHKDMYHLFDGYPELLEEFSSFLLPDQAKECGCLMAHLEFQKARTFLRKLEIHFKRLPGMLQRVLKALAKWEKMPVKNLTDLKEEIRPLLKGQQYLLDEFSTFFMDEKAPESYLADCEDVDIPSGDELDDPELYDGYEQIKIPGGDDSLYGTIHCKCKCHNDTSSAKRRYMDKKQHCISCGVKVYNGRLYMISKNRMRPLHINFVNKPTATEVESEADNEDEEEELSLSDDADDGDDDKVNDEQEESDDEKVNDNGQDEFDDDKVLEDEQEEFDDDKVIEDEQEEFDDEKVIEDEQEEFDDEKVIEDEQEEFDDEKVIEDEQEEFDDEKVIEDEQEEFDNEKVIEDEQEEFESETEQAHIVKTMADDAGGDINEADDNNEIEDSEFEQVEEEDNEMEHDTDTAEEHESGDAQDEDSDEGDEDVLSENDNDKDDDESETVDQEDGDNKSYKENDNEDLDCPDDMEVVDLEKADGDTHQEDVHMEQLDDSDEDMDNVFETIEKKKSTSPGPTDFSSFVDKITLKKKISSDGKTYYVSKTDKCTTNNVITDENQESVTSDKQDSKFSSPNNSNSDKLNSSDGSTSANIAAKVDLLPLEQTAGNLIKAKPPMLIDETASFHLVSEDKTAVPHDSPVTCEHVLGYISDTADNRDPSWSNSSHSKFKSSGETSHVDPLLLGPKAAPATSLSADFSHDSNVLESQSKETISPGRSNFINSSKCSEENVAENLSAIQSREVTSSSRGSDFNGKTSADKQPTEFYCAIQQNEQFEFQQAKKASPLSSPQNAPSDSETDNNVEWTMDDDKLLLELVKNHGDNSKTFEKLAISLKRTKDQVEHRLRTLIEDLLSEDSSDEEDEDTEDDS